MALISESKSLSLKFTICCIIDLFGVFPIIALARGIIECGWIGVPLALVVFLIQIYTALLLGKCWILAEKLCPDIKTKIRYPYSALAELTYGPKLSAYITTILSLTIFGAMIPHLIVASQNLEAIGIYLLPNEINISFCAWILVLAAVLCPVMWLGSPKDMKWLTVISMTTVIGVACLTWSCLILEPADQVTIPQPSWQAVGIVFGILAFQFDIHPVLLTVQMDMKKRQHLGYAVIFGFIVIGTLSMVTVSLAYRLHGTSIQFNILKGLAPNPIVLSTLVLVTLQVSLSTVVGSSGLFQQVEHKLSIKPEFGWTRCLLRGIIMLAAVVVAETVPRLDLMMSLIGGCMTSQLMFIWPCVIYRRLRHMAAHQPSHHQTPQSAHYGSFGEQASLLHPEMAPKPAFLSLRYPSHPHIPANHFSSLISMDPSSEGPLPLHHNIVIFFFIIFGIATMLVSSYYSIKETIFYADFTPPCIENATKYFYM